MQSLAVIRREEELLLFPFGGGKVTSSGFSYKYGNVIWSLASEPNGSAVIRAFFERQLKG